MYLKDQTEMVICISIQWIISSLLNWINVINLQPNSMDHPKMASAPVCHSWHSIFLDSRVKDPKQLQIGPPPLGMNFKKESIIWRTTQESNWKLTAMFSTSEFNFNKWMKLTCSLPWKRWASPTLFVDRDGRTIN